MPQEFAPGLQCRNRVQHESNSGLHVERARPPEPPISDPAGHVGERADRINRVDVS